MSVIAGLLCRDGIAIISDSAATTEIHDVVGSVHQMRKIEVIGNQLVLAVAGPSGLAQEYAHCMGHLVEGCDFDSVTPLDVQARIRDHELGVLSGKIQLAKDLKDLTGAAFDSSEFQAESLIAVRVGGAPQLYRVRPEMVVEWVVPESPFVVIGSGATTTHAFIEYIRKEFLGEEAPDLGEGILVLLWGLKFAIATGAKGVGGDPQITLIPSDPQRPIQQLDDADLAEHQEVLSRAEAGLRGLRFAVRGQAQPGDGGVPEQTQREEGGLPE